MKLYPVTFLVAPAPQQQSNLSSYCGVCLLACGQITFLLEINTSWLCPDIKDTPQEVLKDTLQS